MFEKYAWAWSASRMSYFTLEPPRLARGPSISFWMLWLVTSRAAFCLRCANHNLYIINNSWNIVCLCSLPGDVYSNINRYLVAIKYAPAFMPVPRRVGKTIPKAMNSLRIDCPHRRNKTSQWELFRTKANVCILSSFNFTAKNDYCISL